MGYYDNLQHDLLCKKCNSPTREGNIGQSQRICTNCSCIRSNPFWEEIESEKYHLSDFWREFIEEMKLLFKVAVPIIIIFFYLLFLFN